MGVLVAGGVGACDGVAVVNSGEIVPDALTLDEDVLCWGRDVTVNPGRGSRRVMGIGLKELSRGCSACGVGLVGAVCGSSSLGSLSPLLEMRRTPAPSMEARSFMPSPSDIVLVARGGGLSLDVRR